MKPINFPLRTLATLCWFVVIAPSVLLSNMASAAQEFRVKDGDTITVKLSSREPTRLAVANGGRLDKVWAKAGVLDIQPDKEKGEVFIVPNPSAAPALSFFARDDMGSTYTIVAQQHDVPGETIILKPAASRKSIGRGSEYRSTPYVDRVKRLMKGMALGQDIDGYSFEDSEQKVPLWAETNISLNRVYTGFDLLGEVYTIENISADELNFHEREFLDFGDDVQAVALERLSLAKGETTFLYVVRKLVEDK